MAGNDKQNRISIDTTPEDVERQQEFARVANQQAGKSSAQYAPVCPEYLSAEQAEAWEQDGYFIIRGMVPEAECTAINNSAIELVRKIADGDQDATPDATIKYGFISIAEKNFTTDVREAEDRASKLYNLHRHDVFRRWSRNSHLVKCLGGILGPNVDVFNSQFIFKNPGAWGQPWHQDSLYFNFDRSPQVGVWLATSKATISNGCLFVAPGSHKESVHEHLPDSRPDANVGYMEIRDYDFSSEKSVEMQVGDVLIFHSFLMHKSVDNLSDQRRTALVYHCTAAGTKAHGLIKSPTIDWMEVLRNHQAVSPEKSHRVREVINQLKLGVLSNLLALLTKFKRKHG